MVAVLVVVGEAVVVPVQVPAEDGLEGVDVALVGVLRAAAGVAALKGDAGDELKRGGAIGVSRNVRAAHGYVSAVGHVRAVGDEDGVAGGGGAQGILRMKKGVTPG